MRVHRNGFREQLAQIMRETPWSKAQHSVDFPIFFSIRAVKITSYIMAVFGICCVVFTEHIYRILPVALGITMIVQGIFETWIGWKTEEYKEKETKLTSNGIVFLILGSVILCNYSNADFIIGAIWGVLSLVKGSEKLNQVLYRRIHKAPYRSKLIHCCIELLLGLILLIDPSASIKHHVFLLGIEVFVVSMQNIQELKASA